MSGATLVIGYGSGIGAHLFRSLRDSGIKIGVSRSLLDDELPIIEELEGVTD